jgi:hypothetical protein
MKKDKSRAYCPRCRHQQVFVEAEICHTLHLGLSILTCGLWLVSWIALCIGKLIRPWRCEHCGWHSPEFNRASQAGPFHPDKPVSRRRRPSLTTAPADPSSGAPSPSY